MDILVWLNENIIWGIPMLALFIGAGIFFSIRIKFCQFTGLNRIFKATFFSKEKSGDGKNLSPFQTLTATLGTTLGTGNIIAVGTAVVIGGAGSVFWMWLSAMLGMATCYAENALGMKYRRKNADGTYFGGSFLYLEAAFGKWSGVLFACLCIFGSLFMGNMAQMNAMSSALSETFGAPQQVVGIAAALLLGAIIFGGARTFGKITEKVIPLFAGMYIIGCIIVIILNMNSLGYCFSRIFREAFGFREMSAGISGGLFIQAMGWGFRRGIFSNEAGLGSSVMFASASSLTSPQKQGMWSMLSVFIDTIIICTLTAVVIIITGADKTAADGTQTAIAAFSGAFGGYAGMFVAISLVVFAISTAAGWSVFGATCVEYLIGRKGVKPFLAVFSVLAFIGSTADMETVWQLSDFFNGTMAALNISGIVRLAFMSENRFLFNITKTSGKKR